MTGYQEFDDALASQCPLILPAAHDALTALIFNQEMNIVAYQIGGLALHAAAGYPDVGVRGMAESLGDAVRILDVATKPVLVDAEDGFGDVKHVSRTVSAYRNVGAAALFLEDEAPPKKCGHMAGKKVVSCADMVGKIKAACATAQGELFLIARTDALEPEGVEAAVSRALWYRDAGADAVYVEAIPDEATLEYVGRALDQCILGTSILEGGGKTPWRTPAWFGDRGYDFLLYPTTVLFRVINALAQAAADVGARQTITGDQMAERVNLLLGLDEWARIENLYTPKVSK